jgi:asparagine synthase (glutamine-hydrolysing)
MCGICGLVVYGWHNGDDPDVLSRMRDTMAHRGPDDTGSFRSADGRVQLGHRRLSIVDLSAAGHQPMSNEDGTVWIAFNGEIYNHLELRPGLEARGHLYRSATDTETLIHLYEELGEDMLPKLRGMFAFAIWDERRQKLFVARDRIGIKPFYYTQVDGRFLFASEIKALTEHPAVSPDIDETALYHYLTFMTTPAPSTLFAGIRKLPAGHCLTLDVRTGGLATRRWWDVAHAPAPDPRHMLTPDACAERVAELLEEGVRDRLMADVPFGVLLSGGVDSTALTGLVRRMHTGPLRTFSVGFTDAPELNELEHAHVAARHFDTEHHEVVVDPDDVLRYIPSLIHAQDEPLADWVCVPLHYVCKLVRDSGTIVGLVGEGSDEQFAGYGHYHRYARLQRGAWGVYNRLPRQLLNGIHRLVDRPLQRSGAPREIRELFRRAAAGEPLFISGAVAAWEADKRDILCAGGTVWGGMSSSDIATASARHFLGARPGAGFVEAMIYQEFQLRLPELLLMRVDKIGMANSIEPRVPFLDHRLVEFTSHIPAAWNIGGGRTKDILKRAVAGLVPDEITNRPKQGFSLPVKQWLRGPLAGFARQSIFGSRLRERGLLDYAAIRGIVEAHIAGRCNADTLIWSLINLSQWYDRWIAREPVHAEVAR